MEETREKAYWLDGKPYCDTCIALGCMSEEEIARCVIDTGIGRCSCCGSMFNELDMDLDE